MYRVLTQSYESEQQKVSENSGLRGKRKKAPPWERPRRRRTMPSARYSGSSATFSRFSTASTISSHAAGFGFKIS